MLTNRFINIICWALLKLFFSFLCSLRFRWEFFDFEFFICTNNDAPQTKRDSIDKMRWELMQNYISLSMNISKSECHSQRNIFMFFLCCELKNCFTSKQMMTEITVGSWSSFLFFIYICCCCHCHRFGCCYNGAQ